MQCRVGLLPVVPVLLPRCGRHSARQAPVPRGRVAHSAWRRLGSSVDAPPGVQALPLPVLRVAGQLPTSVQSRCTSDIVARSQSGFLHHLELLVQLL